MSKPDKIVAQHNALINARFSFVPLQMRLFLALLARIEFDDIEFREHFVSFNEIGFEDRGGSSYQQLQEVCKTLPSFTLYLEKLVPGTRKRSKQPVFEVISLMAKTEYRPDLGGIIAIFNPLIMPYLLQLRETGNFTTAALAELHKIKTPSALRIYWLLKEYATFGERTLSLEQLRFILDIAKDEYPRFSNFKARVLDKAQKELASTDMPFSYALERQNQIVQRIKFLIERTRKVENVESVELIKNTQYTENAEDVQPSVWQQKLLAAGVSKRSLAHISQQLASDEYGLDYIEFVLTRVTKQKQLGKVKKPAGAIYKALSEKYLLTEFLEAQAKPAKKLKTPAKVEEIALRLAEVKQMFQNPGPFLKKIMVEETFQEHMQRLYLAEGFQLENRGGEEWLVKR